jgi:hypothetical protein
VKLASSYRIESAFVGALCQPRTDGRKLATLPVGSVVSVVAETSDDPNLVKVELEGEVMEVFKVDLDTRAKPLPQKAATR